MSVLARLRGKSQLDVLQLAEEIRAEATNTMRMILVTRLYCCRKNELYQTD